MADRTLDQRSVDDEFTANDILTNCRQYPKDEAPAAYKDFDAVRREWNEMQKHQRGWSGSFRLRVF